MPHGGDEPVQSPVQDPDHAHPEDDRKLRDSAALCLSGGGYRAMLFHVGTILRLNELGQLRSLGRVSSVSGGSITAATLGVGWKDLTWDDNDVATNLNKVLVEPIVGLAGQTIDAKSIIFGLLTPGRSIGDNVKRAYDKHLFHGATLDALPTGDDNPRFVLNATNVQTGKLYRFSRPYEGDWTIGLWRDTKRPIAEAVAASSAFPPVLSPLTIKPMGTFDTSTRGFNARGEMMKKIWLSDGGVYDNLGLETAWKQHHTVLISDGGGELATVAKPKRDWARHGIRVAGIVDGQVRALRRRQAIQGYTDNDRDGAFWGIQSDVADYQLADPFPISETARDAARTVPTRLEKLSPTIRQSVIHWGYVIADTALRRHVYPDATRPTSLPRVAS